MNKLEQAARQALEALTGMLAIVDDSQAVAGYHLNGELETWEGFPEVEEARVAITALREALEAQEPWTPDDMAYRPGGLSQHAAVEQEPWTFKQFLSDVLTAAGLLEHGKRSKALADRLAEGVRTYMASAPQHAAVGQEPVSRDQIREVFLAHGFTIKVGQADLKQYVYDAAYALLAVCAAPQPAAQTQDPAAWAITYDGRTPHTLWHEGDGPLLDLEIKRQGGSVQKMALYTTPQPTRQPLSDDWIRGMCKESWVFDAAKQWIRIAERAHGIGGEA